MPRSASALATLALWVLICALVTVYGAGWTSDNRLGNWAGQIAEDPGYNVLVQRFGGDEIVLLRIDGLETAGPEAWAWLPSLGERLLALPAVSTWTSPLELPGKKGEGREAFLEAARRPLARALQLVDESRDRCDGILVVRSQATPSERLELEQFLNALSIEAEAQNLRMRPAGHPLVAAALDRAAARVERVFAPALAVVALIGIGFLLRSVALAVFVLLPAILASSGSRAVLRFLGTESDILLVAIGPITFVLLIATTLHLVSAFRRHFAAEETQAHAALSARNEKLAAGLLAALTTAAGFGVFRMSALSSVSRLGSAVAVAVLLCVPIAFLGLRPMLAGMPLSRPRVRPTTFTRWRRTATWALRRRRFLIFVACAAPALGAFATTRLAYETNALHYFPTDSLVRANFQSIEAEGGALSGVDVLVRKRSGQEWGEGDWAHFDLGIGLSFVPGVRGIFGPSDVHADTVQWLGPTAGLVQSAFLREAGRMDAMGEWLRVTVRFETTEAAPTRELVSAVREHAEGWGRAHDAEVMVAGSVPLMLGVQAALARTLAESLGWTLLVTTLFFLLIVRSVRALASAVLTNLFPVATVLLAAWGFGIPLDGATVMVAAVVLGLAVDNTLHILHAARSGTSPRIRLRAFERVGEPALVSSLALALGFATLALSGFAPTARFGTLAAVGSASAWVADMWLLPALWVRIPASGV